MSIYEALDLIIPSVLSVVNILFFVFFYNKLSQTANETKNIHKEQKTMNERQTKIMEEKLENKRKLEEVSTRFYIYKTSTIPFMIGCFKADILNFFEQGLFFQQNVVQKIKDSSKNNKTIKEMIDSLSVESIGEMGYINKNKKFIKTEDINSEQQDAIIFLKYWKKTVVDRLVSWQKLQIKENNWWNNNFFMKGINEEYKLGYLKLQTSPLREKNI